MSPRWGSARGPAASGTPTSGSRPVRSRAVGFARSSEDKTTTRKVSYMSQRIVPGQGLSVELADWPGSPLSTLHHQASTAPIRTEAYVSGGRYVVRFELPGIDPETGLDVSVEAGVLSVHAERPAAEAG